MRLSGSIPFSLAVAGEASRAERAALGDAKGADPATAQSPMDEAAFRRFYGETAPKLRAYIRRVCGDAALADDILQEAFYRFLRADISRAPRAERHFEAWQRKAYLYRAANSLLTDHWRRLGRERRWRLREFFGGQSEPSAEQTDELGAMRFFRRLKPQEQALLWLAYVEGFEHREIAAALQIREKSVRVLLFRARKKLGAALSKEGFGGRSGSNRS